MSDLVARGAANPQTIREHLEAQVEDINAWQDSDEDANALLQRLHADAVAALDLLDNTEAWYRDQHHYELGGWGEVQLHSNDDCVRLVPDPAPRGDAE